MTAFYGQFVNKGDLCFDIGANIGNRTTVFLSIGAKVASVEPQSACITVLEKKFGQNPAVSIVQKAIGSEAATQEMMIANMNEVSTLSKEFVKQFQKYDYLNWNQTETVEVITLDQLIEDLGMPQFCKIDVEGYEVEVLKGLSTALPALSFEYTAPLKKDAVTCVNLLCSLGKYKFNYSTYESMRLNLVDWQGQEDFLKTLADIPKEVLHGDVYAVLVEDFTPNPLKGKLSV